MKGEYFMAREVCLKALAEKWPSAIVAREKVDEFTGGAVNPKTQANLDARGEGPADVVRIGRKICYPVMSYIAWLESRSTAGRE